jgi:hypothetical protein
VQKATAFGRSRFEPIPTAQPMMEPIAPPLVVVKETGTPKGRGVFAGRDYRAGDLVEESPVVFIEHAFEELPDAMRKMVFNWGALSGNPAGHALALGYGSLYNHDNPANMRYGADPQRGLLRFVAARDIGRGEELTINYNAVGGGAEWRDDNWFERLDVTPIISSTAAGD